MNPTFYKVLFLCGLITILPGCAEHKYTLAPIKTFDPDNAAFPKPEAKTPYTAWDIVDNSFFYQLGKPLNLNWTLRQLGNPARISRAPQADNVNVLDDVPDSSWFTNRHYKNPMSLEKLKLGPDINSGPDQSNTWLIIQDKSEGMTPGFWIKDSKGDTYVLKFDTAEYPELSSSAEVISTKIFYACGYNVPQNTIVYFNPKILRVKEGIKIKERKREEPMNMKDVELLLSRQPKRKDGKVRVMASKFIENAVGFWEYKGTDKNDPNDLVKHEHRRELRGMRVISSWLNDTDRRAANTLSAYTDENFIRHYVIDMGYTLGNKSISYFYPKYGNEYLWDPKQIGLAFMALGGYVKPWEFIEPEIKYPSVGYFQAEIFYPGAWYPSYPNPAFEYMTLRDAFWGAKHVTSFSNEDIRAIVETAQMTDKSAQEYLIQTLIDRRNKIGRYWFSRITPLDKFQLKKDEKTLTLTFTDLAVESGLESQWDTQYPYTLSHRKSKSYKTGEVAKPAIIISENGRGFFDDALKNFKKNKDDENRVFCIEIQAQREKDPLGKAVKVCIYYPGPQGKPQIVSIQR